MQARHIQAVTRIEGLPAGLEFQTQDQILLQDNIGYVSSLARQLGPVEPGI